MGQSNHESQHGCVILILLSLQASGLGYGLWS